MRLLIIMSLFFLPDSACGQSDLCSYRYNYAFIEDSKDLIPLQGSYTVEYLARGQWWSYTDPRIPVNYPGKPMQLKSLITVNGTSIKAVEVGWNYTTTDNKLRVVRGVDTMIVDLAGNGDIEERMLARTARVGVPPRPPVLLPFRNGWFVLAQLNDPINAQLTEQFDALWMAQRTEVMALYDTARYEFSLIMNFSRIGPLEIPIMRDPNYANHLLHFPASGPDTHFELSRQDTLGVAESNISLRVDMPTDGETDKWVDVTDLPYGRYSTYLKWKDQQSLFYLTFGW
ncbi:MAG: hypothetical protein IPF95_17605 [Flavobacteriales bacterium]|nr:hypothetical protein [Flavobacteriales bacterium]MBK6946240.1 hypothetical protein [Flavobacteriales bacterium]MBK7297623.1 hypothetical protein [Flavobacteriales bacterium]MBK9537066.1 hypothetical protein [Flavobacteriales bacterium]MBP9137967.1 hypothetical protein [Flavobacteriales bacterium]